MVLSAIAAFGMVVYFVGYVFYRCYYREWALDEPDTRACVGLDPSVLKTFPVFVYSDGNKPNKGPLECAVCLGLFEEEETLRTLPDCGHMFHVDCIDAWLAGHCTCPLCRACLVPQPDKLGCVTRLWRQRRGEVNTERNDVVETRREMVVVQLGEHSQMEVNRTVGEV
ncbi:putative RING-H2 finger protein ATL35 [Bienertia sinuspersici]